MRHWPLWLRQVNKRVVQVQERFVRNQRVIGLPFYLTLGERQLLQFTLPTVPDDVPW